MQKTAFVSGFCPFFNEEVTIKAIFLSAESTVSQRYAIPYKNLCQNAAECNIEAKYCPVFDRNHPWNEL